MGYRNVKRKTKLTVEHTEVRNDKLKYVDKGGNEKKLELSELAQK